MLFKVKSELESQLSANLNKIENEVNKIRDKQSSLATTIDISKKIDQEREIALSLQKPAQMLDELKSHFQRVMDSQSDEMRDLIQKTVH